MFYSSKILEKILVFKGTSYADFGTLAIFVLQVLMTFVCIAVIDKFGRKILLLIGTIGMCIFAFGIAIFQIIIEKNEYIKTITVKKIKIYIVLFHFRLNYFRFTYSKG